MLRTLFVAFFSMIAFEEDKVKKSEKNKYRKRIAAESTADIPNSFSEELNLSVINK